MHIKNFQHPELQIDEFVTQPGETWCILGKNNSGVDLLPDLFSNNLNGYSAEILHLPDNLGLLSFTVQQEIFEEELRNDDTDFLNKIDQGTLVRDFLPGYENHLQLITALEMDHCLDLGYRQLSNGQTRKLTFLQKLIDGVTCLVIHNPYDGLDAKSCRELDQILISLQANLIETVLVVNSKNDVPDWCSHLALINSGKLLHAGTMNQIRPLIRNMQQIDETVHAPIAGLYAGKTPDINRNDELIRLRNGFASYGDNILFKGLDLTLHTGDHTLITGKNGCGKSTLLDILIGDNPKCYANNFRIFGKQRGSGESIWELKKHMGIVSPTLHREHRVPASALQVVLSGLYDSIGLYRQVKKPEIDTAMRWINWLSLSEKAKTPFKRLTFAEQRLVLIGRALIKHPKLLILDEPTQGLDDAHRTRLLDLLEKIADKDICTILFVSHRQDEHRPFFIQRIELDSYASQPR